MCWSGSGWPDSEIRQRFRVAIRKSPPRCEHGCRRFVWRRRRGQRVVRDRIPSAYHWRVTSPWSLGHSAPNLDRTGAPRYGSTRTPRRPERVVRNTSSSSIQNPSTCPSGKRTPIIGSPGNASPHPAAYSKWSTVPVCPLRASSNVSSSELPTTTLVPTWTGAPSMWW